jgi:hypothetical protein
MKKFILKILFFTLVVFAPFSAMAEVNVYIDIPLPPPIIFPAPPEMVVIPETDVYAVPDMEEEIFFTAVGGGVPGKGAGTAHITMIEVGLITSMFHFFTEISIRVGGMITGIIGGKDISGTISGYLSANCNVIGRVGKKTGIGKSKTTGVSGDYSQDNILLEW